MKKIFLCFLLTACVGSGWTPPEDFQYLPIKTDTYEIATWQKINDIKNNNIHIYIEGDGHSFDSYGQPTTDPTPHRTFLRDLATADDFENVVYVARPCQFIKDKNCTKEDWTNGRFSQKIIDAESQVIKKIAKNKHIVLIGYSGGGMVSGLVINRNPRLRVDKWITIAGVLNHETWTSYFGDKPLDKSLNLEKLPQVPQTHFAGGRDKVVPYTLVQSWVKEKDIKLIPDSAHDDFKNIKIFD